MHRLASRDPAPTPLASNFGPNRATYCGSSSGADGVECLIPGRQDFPGRAIDVVAARLLQDGKGARRRASLIRVRPPDPVVRRGEGLPKLVPG
jgi:hypothetical protein